jgi:hypothetical protein
MLREIGLEEKLMFGCATFELSGIQVVGVKEKFHGFERPLPMMQKSRAGTCSISASGIVKGVRSC